MFHIKETLNAPSFEKYIKDRFFPISPAPVALSLVCRDGAEDRLLYRLGLFKRGVGVDESSDDLQIAERAAQNENLPIQYLHTALDSTFSIDDLGRFPIIYSIDSLYYARDLECILTKIHDLLLPDGVFVFSGYCGANRLFLPDHVLTICNRLLKCLPDYLRKDHTIISKYCDDQSSGSLSRSNISSEMIRSTINYVFGEVEEISLGTTITYPILGPILANFSLQNDSEVSLLLLLQVIEHILIKHRIIDSIMKIIVARPKR
jgi:SAM-dependent methyltransferase